MKIGFNNQYNVSFKSNAGVLKAIESLKVDDSPRMTARLQAEAKTAKLTPEFIAEIERVTPEDLKILAKKILGLIPWN
jgi:hypothetical protein